MTDRTKRQSNIGSKDSSSSDATSENMSKPLATAIEPYRGSHSIHRTLNSEIKLLDTAGLRIVSEAEQFGATLSVQAKLLAMHDGLDVVSERHVERAREILTSRESSNRRGQTLTVFGGALFGAAISGYVYALLPALESATAAGGGIAVASSSIELIVSSMMLIFGAALILMGIFGEK